MDKIQDVIDLKQETLGTKGCLKLILILIETIFRIYFQLFEISNGYFFRKPRKKTN